MPSTNPLLSVVGILLRHKFKVITFVAVFMVLVVAAIVYLPRQYASESKLLIRIGRETATLDATATVGQTLQVFQTREEEINSVLDILRSRHIAEIVAEKLGVAEILGSGQATAGASSAMAIINSLLDPIRKLDPISDRERAIRHLQERVTISSPKASGVVTIRCRDRAPELAQKITQAWVDAFMQENVRLNHTQGSYEFFVGQEELLKDQLTKAARALGDAKNEFGLLSITGQQRILEEQLGAVEGRILTNDAAISSARASVNELRKHIDSLPETLITENVTGMTNDARDGMRQQLFDLEIRERDLMAKYSGQHPLVIAVQKQRLQVEEILKQQIEKTQTTEGLNPVRQQLRVTFLADQSRLESLRAEGKVLAEQRTGLQDKLHRLNNQEVQLAQLEQGVNVMSTKYRLHAEKLEQARIGDALENESITSVSVVQYATLEEKPVSPQKAITLLMGLMAAVFGGCGIALIADYRDQSFTTPTQVEQALDLPVLVTLPRNSGQAITPN